MEKDHKNDEGVISIPGIGLIGEIQWYGRQAFPN
jgi:hypothetical protein